MNAPNNDNQQQDAQNQTQGAAAPRLTRKPEELVSVLGIGRNTIYELIRTGQLRSIRVGRKLLVPLSAVDEFLAGTSA